MRKVLTAVVVAFAVVAAPAHAAKRHSCAMRGSKTVRADGRARVFYVAKRDAYYSCLYAHGKRHRLVGPYDYDFGLGDFRLRTPYLAFTGAYGGSGVVSYDLLLHDVRTGRTTPIAEFYSASDGSSELESLLLSRTGTVAWIRADYYNVDGPEIHRKVETRGEWPDEPKVLDPGPDVRRGSLAMTRSGRRIYWMNAGEPRTATLR